MANINSVCLSCATVHDEACPDSFLQPVCSRCNSLFLDDVCDVCTRGHPSDNLFFVCMKCSTVVKDPTQTCCDSMPVLSYICCSCGRFGQAFVECICKREVSPAGEKEKEKEKESEVDDPVCAQADDKVRKCFVVCWECGSESCACDAEKRVIDYCPWCDAQKRAASDCGCCSHPASYKVTEFTLCTLAECGGVNCDCDRSRKMRVKRCEGCGCIFPSSLEKCPFSTPARYEKRQCHTQVSRIECASCCKEQDVTSKCCGSMRVEWYIVGYEYVTTSTSGPRNGVRDCYRRLMALKYLCA